MRHWMSRVDAAFPFSFAAPCQPSFEGQKLSSSRLCGGSGLALQPIGEALCRQLRDHHGDDIVLIAVSGYNDERIAGSFAMAAHCFAKPMDSDSLMSVLAPVK